MSDAERRKTKIIYRRLLLQKKYFMSDLINPVIKLENVSFSK